ncbi:MAG: 4-(cytidine 5'-diphospho)-2-C-methyl-D-erythritol kinase [Clostridiales bacterium]|nr:4-(cytidine 5'-diphospho)-2-C-methyl-D-erythritol kinase [Candidatus Cacconaster stercorequi]
MIITELAPAKLNLTLEIGQKRPDGYHDLVSIMTCAGLYDTVTVEETGDGCIAVTCDDAALPCDESNLAWRAASVFFDAANMVCPGVRIHLQKKIPMQAGLGGGSADAAAVLRALRNLYAPEVATETLEELGAELGSDVPFCVRGGTARCEGRGEKMETLPDMLNCWYVIVKPREAHPTGAMYGAIDRLNPIRRHTTVQMTVALTAGDLNAMAENLYNTFEDVLPESSEIPAIRALLLRCGALGAMMSGSGSAVFGLFADQAAAQAAYETACKRWPRTFLAQSV